jgi:tetratricopeptide (TPR) repeat protein
MIRPALASLVLALLAALGALGVPAARADDAVRVRELLGAIESGRGDRARDSAALVPLAEREVPAFAAFLDRERASSVEERRAVLRKIKASVPDASGKFETPKRMQAEQIREDDEFDWLAELASLDPATPGLGAVWADVAAIRALSSTQRIDAAAVILEQAFKKTTIIYRDECGRRLRAMAPYSLPALTEASQAEERPRARYATYQLERLDRQEPGKAMEATGHDEELRVAQLATFGKVRHREATATVFAYIDDDAPRVRAAARAAWLEYVTGPPPPDAPKIHLQLTGGRKDPKLTPLYLTYRELAAIELERASEELLERRYEDDEKLDVAAVSQEIFAFHDRERARKDGERFARAAEQARTGDLAGAAASFDRLLAENPELANRGEAVPTYLALAREHEQAKRWSEAAAAYGKAHGLAPDGPEAVNTAAGREYALGKALEAAGKDGGANFRRAAELRPDYAPAKAAAARTTPTARNPLLLWAAVGGAAAALALLLLGLVRRRA